MLESSSEMVSGKKEADSAKNEPGTREAIIAAAVRTFLSKGYEGTSMDLVAKEAQVGRRTVYNQFDSKKALFDATVARLWKNNPLAEIVSGFDKGLPPEEGLRQLGNSIAEFWQPDEAIAFTRMIVAESIRFPELAETFVKAGRNPARRAVTEYLQALHKAGLICVPDPDFARDQFVELILSQLAWVRVLGESSAPSKKRMRHVVDEAVKMFLARYAVPK